MHNHLVRMSKADSLPLAKATLYKWHHLNKCPGLFVKIGGALFVDLKFLEKIVEEGRGK
jgi:hypothetical protein